jgi:hypothetical protein
MCLLQTPRATDSLVLSCFLAKLKRIVSHQYASMASSASSPRQIPENAATIA